MPAYKAILWDNDGILVDTEQWFFQATQEAFGEKLIDLSLANFVRYFLEGSKGTTVFGRLNGLLDQDIGQLKQHRNARFRQLLRSEEIVISGAKDALEELKPHYAMGVVTSSLAEAFKTSHDRTGLLPYFDFVVTREDYRNSKPAPDPYLAGIARTGFGASQCIAIEDSPRGLAAAKAAGVDCITIPTQLTMHADFSGAKHRLKSITQLATLLASKAN